MEDKKNKPVYKKWWFWLVAFLVFGFVVGQTSDNEERTEDVEQEPEDGEKPKEEPNEESKTEETEEVDKKEEELQEKKQTIDINKEIEFDMGNLTLDIESVYVEDNTMSFGFWWNYWSSYDEAHFLLFAYPVVKQNGEELEEVDEKDSLLRQTKKGVDSRVDLEYELEDDSPVEIKIKTTSDDPEEEVIEFDIK